MKTRKSILAGTIAAAMLCQSACVPGASWIGTDLSNVHAAARNVALNKTATASGVEEGMASCTPDKAVDGTASADSRWSAPQMKTGNESGQAQTPQWLMLDLKADATEVESIKITYFRLVWSTQYKIQTSATGADGSWEDVYVQPERAGSGSTDVVDTIQASAMTKSSLKRYVRFYFEKVNPQAGGNSVSVQEIEINGTQEGADNTVSSAADALQAIGALTVGLEDTDLRFPEVSDAYDIKVYGSEVDKVLGDDGRISPLRIGDRSMNVIVKATNKTNASDTAKKNFTVAVPDNTAKFPELFPQVSNPNPMPDVLPTIQEWYGYEGDFQVDESTKIVYCDAANLGLADVAKEMQEDLTEICGFTPEVEEGTSHGAKDIYLESLTEDRYGAGEEGYLMVTSEDGLSIYSSGKSGAVYGTVTAEQILYQDPEHRLIPQGVIRDYPLFEVRGIMFDVARIPTRMAFLEDYTKILKWYKLNEMQLHLNDNQWSEPAYSPDPAKWMEVEASHRLYSDYFPSLAKQESKFWRAGDNEGRYDYYYNVHTGMKEKTGEAGELYYTKEEYKNLEHMAGNRGVQIIAELDTPGHSAAYNKYVYNHQEEVIQSLVEHGYLERSEYLDASGKVKEGASFYIHNTNNFELLALDEGSSNAQMAKNAKNAKIFMTALFDEYLDEEDPTFGTSTVNAGVDEYWDKSGNNQNSFRNYMNYMYDVLGNKHGKEVRMWGALEAIRGNVEVNKNIILEIWNGRGEDNAQNRINEGFRVVNIPQLFMYTTPGRYHKDMVREEYVYYNWDPMLYDGPNNGQRITAGEPAALGAKAALWGDENREGITEADLNERYVRVAAMLGEKTWGGAKAGDTFTKYEQKFDRLREGPGTRIANQIDSKSNVVLDYDFEHVSADGETIYDASGNGYHGTITNGETAEKDGETMMAFDGSTTIETPLQSLGYPYTMSFDIYLDQTGENTKESSLFSGYDGRLQVAGLNGELSLNRDYFGQSFGYTVESGKKHKITIVGTYQATKLYVDGQFRTILYAAASDPNVRGTNALGNQTWTDAVNNYRTTFVFPLRTIGKDFKGYLGNVKAYNKALSVDEILADGSSVTEVDVARNRGAYEDNHNTTYGGDEKRLYPAWKATDGDGHVEGVEGTSTSYESHWQSSNHNEDTLLIDLRESRSIQKVVIDWNTGKYAAAYKLLTSVDGNTWTEVKSVTGNTSALTSDTFSPVTARYVKMQGVQRKSGANEYGIYEVKVYSAVDKSALAGKIAEAEALLDKENIGWDAEKEGKLLHDSVVAAKAVCGDVLAGQEETDAACEELADLVKGWANGELKLMSVVEEYQAILSEKDSYAEASWNAFIEALEAAKASKDLTAEENQKLLDRLMKAKAALAGKPTQEQIAKLQEAVANAAGLLAQKDSYEAASFAKFEAAYQAAKSPAEGISGEQYEVLLNNLEAARRGLVKKTEHKAVKLAAPAVKKVKSTATGVKVTWEASANAASYQLYRKAGGKTVKVNAPVKGTSAVDNAPVGGKNLSYYVVALSKDPSAYIDSDAGSAKSITLPKATAKVTAKQEKGKKSVLVTWKKVKKASSYLVYRSEGKKGKWKKVATVKKGVSYRDKKAKKGKTYSYKIVTVSAKKYSPMKAAKKAVKIK